MNGESIDSESTELQEESALMMEAFTMCEHRKGDTWAYVRLSMVSRALKMCAESGEPLPQWAFGYLEKSISRWSDLECATLDEAFGMEVSSTSSLNKKRNDQIAFTVHARVREIQKNGQAVPWNDLADEFAVSVSKLQTLYYKKKSWFEKQEAYFGKNSNQ